ncbi:MAG: hypothetical protein IKS22_05215 [Bacteroidales bacterium]|nr:hypothetical protein [Bacteroidales bacterium]
MKKVPVILFSVILFIYSLPLVSRASTTIPTTQWNLQLTAYMEQIGIFSDPVNHRGNYDYSAVFSNNTWYSDYYFKAISTRHFLLCGYEAGSINYPYYITMHNKFNSIFVIDQIAASSTYFITDYGDARYDLSYISDQAYFSYDSANGVSFTINGTLETY